MGPDHERDDLHNLKANRRATSEREKVLRREQLLQAALEVFFEKGFEAGRMEDIAQRANLSKGTTYLYYPSKAALFRSLALTRAHPDLKSMRMITASELSFREFMESLFELITKLLKHSDIPKLAKIVIGTSGLHPEITQIWLNTVVEPVLKQLSERILKAVKKGEIRPVKPELAARLILASAAFEGLYSLLVPPLHNCTDQLDKLLQEHMQTLIRGLEFPSRQ